MTVPVPAVNVPLFDQLPLTSIVCVPAKVNGADALIVKFPFTVLVAAVFHVFIPVFVIIRLL